MLLNLLSVFKQGSGKDSTRNPVKQNQLMTWNDSRFNWEQQREIPNVYNISTDLESRHTRTHTPLYTVKTHHHHHLHYYHPFFSALEKVSKS